MHKKLDNMTGKQFSCKNILILTLALKSKVHILCEIFSMLTKYFETYPCLLL